MLIDITLKITPNMVINAQGNETKALVGHLGTHFDVMDKEFPLEYTQRKGIVFDVRHVKDRDIELKDINIELVEEKMFVAFHTGFIEEQGYGSKLYFTKHPQLSDELIESLLNKRISIIGIDFAGVRRGKEHTPKDQYCANKDVFIIENLDHLSALIKQGTHFIAHTYPMNYAEMTGLPCRVIAEIKKCKNLQKSLDLELTLSIKLIVSSREMIGGINMTLEEMKEMQRKNHYSLLVSSKDYLYTANDSGTTPILYKAIKHIHYFKDSIILECNVGKATAILLARSQVQYLHAHTLSKPAKEILDQYQICYSYDHLVDYIENTCKDRMCSLEEKLLPINDLNEGFKIIVESLRPAMSAMMMKLTA